MEFREIVPLRLKFNGRPSAAILETALSSMRDPAILRWPGLEGALDFLYGPDKSERGSDRWRYRNCPAHAIADCLLAFRLMRLPAYRLTGARLEAVTVLIPAAMSPDDVPAFVERRFLAIHDGSPKDPASGWWSGDWLWRRALRLPRA